MPNPKKEVKHGVLISSPKKSVAGLHTHAAYDSKYVNDEFSFIDPKKPKSASDEKWVATNQVPLYMATPLGTLKVLKPDGSNIIISTDIPHDSNHPGKK